MPHIKINNKQLCTVLLLIIVFILSVTDSWKIFNCIPLSVHQWRQSDCAAYIKTFYHAGNNLFQPATLNLAGINGHVASEFPILYYLTAEIQHIVGEDYWVIRSLNFLCYLSGLIALLSIIRKWITDPIIVMFLVIIYATSPYYYYYAINFLPNVPAIGISFIGLYFFLRYEEYTKTGYIIIGTLAFVLSTALKPTDGGILWLAFIGTKLCQMLFYKGNPNWRKLIPYMISSLVIAICIISWIKYVNWYNDKNGNHQNLIGILPIWIMDKQSITDTFRRMRMEWINVFQQKSLIGVWCFCLITYFLKWRQLNQFLKTFTLFILIGTLGYSVLWFVAFFHHDYYQLPFVLPGIFVPFTVLEYFVRKVTSRAPFKYKISGYALCCILATISIYHNINIQKNRFSNPLYVYINPAIFEMEPYLNSIGVSPSEKVICAPDPSSNISLNAINRYGFTEVYIDSTFNKNTFSIPKFKLMGANYLILLDSTYFHDPKFGPYLNKQIGEYKGIYVYDLR